MTPEILQEQINKLGISYTRTYRLLVDRRTGQIYWFRYYTYNPNLSYTYLPRLSRFYLADFNRDHLWEFDSEGKPVIWTWRPSHGQPTSQETATSS